MELIGSPTSPFVRRLRLFAHGRELAFKSVTLQNDREFILSLSPIGKIPILRDQHQVLWDSRQIADYLIQKWSLPKFTLEEQNELTAFAELCDTLVLLFYLKDSGIEDKQIKHIAKLHERAQRLMDFFSQHVPTQWNLLAMSLYSVLDWADFRQMIKLGDFPQLQRWRDAQRSRPGVASTDPRV